MGNVARKSCSRAMTQQSTSNSSTPISAVKQPRFNSLVPILLLRPIPLSPIPSFSPASFQFIIPVPFQFIIPVPFQSFLLASFPGSSPSLIPKHPSHILIPRFLSRLIPRLLSKSHSQSPSLYFVNIYTLLGRFYLRHVGNQLRELFCHQEVGKVLVWVTDCSRFSSRGR